MLHTPKQTVDTGNDQPNPGNRKEPTSMKNHITYAVAMKFLATDVEPAVIVDFLGHALGGPE